MFVQDFKTVDRPYDEVAARLTADMSALLGAALDSTRAEGERLLVKVGPGGWPAVLAKTVEVLPGPVRTQGDGVLFAFSWEAKGGSSLFPRLDADLDVAPFGAGQTVLAIRGRYEPPAGALGRRADQLLLHRLAESTIRSFLDSVCANLVGAGPGDAPVAEHGPGPGPEGPENGSPAPGDRKGARRQVASGGGPGG